MRKTHDHVFAYHGYWDREPEARCRVRIYEDGGGRRPVVIMTELPDNPSTSITNLIEQVCLEVALRHWPGAVSDGTQPAVFVEHYPANRELSLEPSYDLVTFPDWRPRAERRHPTAWEPCGRIRRRYPSPPTWSRVDRVTLTRSLGLLLDDDVDAPLTQVRDAWREALRSRR